MLRAYYSLLLLLTTVAALILLKLFLLALWFAIRVLRSRTLTKMTIAIITLCS